MRESWTDERLDAFTAHADRRFDTLERRMDNGFNRVDADVRALREETNNRFDGIDKRFEAMQDRLDAINRMMFRFCSLAMAALVGIIAALIGVAVQL